MVVTAQKRQEKLQDVPVSLSALDANALTDQHMVQISDYIGMVPGLAANFADAGAVTLDIRGVSTGRNGGNPTVGVTIDDVPVGSSAGLSSGTVPDLDPSNLQSIEVLRGPQGTLYGASSMGGLLKYVTVPPSLSDTRGHLEMDALSVSGGGNGYSVRGSMSAPIVTDKFGMTVSAFVRRDPGYVDNTFLNESDVNKANNYGGRIAGLWQISDGASLQIAALYQYAKGDGSSIVDLDNSAHPINGLTQNKIADTGWFDRTVLLYSANLNIDLGWAKLTSVTGYGRYNEHASTDYTPQTFAQGFASYTTSVTGRTDANLGFPACCGPFPTDKLSEEIRLSSSGSQALSWLAGLFYTREKSPLFFNLQATDPRTGALLLDLFPDNVEENSYREYAGFVDLTYRFTDQFDVQVGGRYSQNKQDYHEVILGPFFPPGAYDVTATSKDDSTTYLFTPRWKFSNDAMAYLRVASGYRPGGPNPGAGIGFPSTFKPDSTKSYELGLKGGTPEGRLRFDLAAFFIDWNNIQLHQTDLSTGYTYYTNGGKARSQGVEFDITAIPLRGLTLTATAGYTDAVLKQSLNGGLIGSSGDPLPYSAKWSASFGAEEKFPIAGTVQAFIGGNVRYEGDRQSDFASAPPPVVRLSMPSYTLLDLRAGVIVSDWRVSLFAQNVTNRVAILGISPQDGFGFSGINDGIVERPRTIGVTLSKNF